MSDVDNNIELLTTLKGNLAKSINNPFRLETLQAKLNFAENLYEEIQTSLVHSESNYSENQLVFLTKASRNLIAEIRRLISLIADRLHYKIAKPKSAKMTEPPPKFNLGLALKLVEKYDGDAVTLQNFIETIELLRDESTDIAEAILIKFIKSRLTGAAHGAIDTAATIAEDIDALKAKFSVKLTPKAVEAEMRLVKQRNSIADYGAEIDKLAAKLSAAYVSNKTFATEAAASSIVQPIAVDVFISGLKNSAQAFLVKARNPTTLNVAISHALESTPVQNDATTLWFTREGNSRHQGNNNRGNNRYNNNNRGNSRQGNNFHGNNHGNSNRNNHNNRNRRNNNFNNDNNNFQRQNDRRYNNNNNYGNNQNRNQNNNNNNHPNYNNFNTQNVRVTEPVAQNSSGHSSNNPNSAEANLIDFFRDA